MEATETKQSTLSKHHLEEEKSNSRLHPSIPSVRGLSVLARRLGELGVGIRAITLSHRLISQKMNSPWAFTLGWRSFKLEPTTSRSEALSAVADFALEEGKPEAGPVVDAAAH